MPNFSILWVGTLALLTSLLSGCALSYESEGRRNLIGFAWIEYAVDEEQPADDFDPVAFKKTILPPATPAVRQKTVGLYVDATQDTSGLGLGYRDVLVVIPEKDAVTEFQFDASNPTASRKKVFLK